jgi:hypothetical protein
VGDQRRPQRVDLRRGLGWRKVSAESDNVFLDMLALLVAAKAGARRMDLYQENAVIKQTYVF